jgi:hypothetical protein
MEPGIHSQRPGRLLMVQRDYGHLGKELNPSLVDARKFPRPAMHRRRTQEPGR